MSGGQPLLALVHVHARADDLPGSLIEAVLLSSQPMPVLIRLLRFTMPVASL